jgi:hypothetical protein
MTKENTLLNPTTPFALPDRAKVCEGKTKQQPNNKKQQPT